MRLVTTHFIAEFHDKLIAFHRHFPYKEESVFWYKTTCLIVRECMPDPVKGWVLLVSRKFAAARQDEAAKTGPRQSKTTTIDTHRLSGAGSGHCAIDPIARFRLGKVIMASSRTKSLTHAVVLSNP